MTEWLKPHQFKPGQSGNPSGLAKLSEEEKIMRENFRAALAAMGTKTLVEIQAIAKDPNQPAPYALLAKSIEWFFKKGNPALMKELLDRTMGKAVQGIELTGKNGEPIEITRRFKDMPKEELLKLLPEAIDVIKKGE